MNEMMPRLQFRTVVGGALRVQILCFVVVTLLSLVSGSEAQEPNMIAIVPLAFYTPETGFAGGGAFIMISNIRPEEPLSKPNQLNVIGYYTQKQQYVIDANMERYYRNSTLRVYVSGDFRKFPDRFWGIGKHTSDDMGEDYTQIALALNGNPMWNVFRFLRIGPYYRFSYYEVTECEEGGILENGNIAGSETSRVSGVGTELSWDSRDNVFYPLRGTFMQLRYVFYHRITGSREEFHQAELDYRQFFKTFGQQVIALQFMATGSGGSVPFQLLPKLGGSSMMRGMYDGRFRDKHSVAFQGEYRVPLFWRFGAVVFGSCGEVFSGSDRFSWGDVRTAGGVGGRFSIMEGQRVNCRLDIGFCEQEIALYFKYQEAF